mgnify:FL=1
MKKKLESELLSIAHRVLKLTGKEDLNKMHNEIALLYQKISILRFLEMESPKGNSEETQIRQEKVDELKDSPDQANESALLAARAELDPNKKTDSEELSGQILGTGLDEANLEIENDQKQAQLFEPDYNSNDTLAVEEEEPLSASENVSLSSSVESSGLHIGLNDRLAFVNHLFENNNEDYDRVISQIKTMDSLEEITDFVQEVIKPDYGNWEGKEEYEERFLEIIGKKFNT